MTTRNIVNMIVIAIAGFGIISSPSCKKDKNNPKAMVYFEQEDQMGRPAISTVFNDAADKDAFNVAIPSMQASAFGPKFKSKLLALNPGYTTNLLGLDADQFTGVLSTDVLNVSTTGVTSFYDGTNVLTGRGLSDDVIDVELILLFGGPDAMANGGLTSDHVDGNDVPFLNSFPYLASPH